MSVIRSQYLSSDTFAELVSTAGSKGDIAYAKDTGLFYAHNGTSFASFGSQMGTLSALLTSSGTPSVSLLAAAGTAATKTISGNNIAGTITLNAGTGIVTGGNLLTLTLADSFTFPNGFALLFTAGNANFAGLLSNLSVTTTKTTATLNSNSLALTIGQSYTGHYFITGW